MPTPTGLRDFFPADSHDDFGGLDRDLRALMQRRRALGLMAGTLLAGCCGGGKDNAASTGTGSILSTSAGSSCSVTPAETEGPFPGDGSNSVDGSVANALALAGIVRSDLRASIAPASGTATGVPLTLTLKLVSAGNACAALAGLAIYVWHCDALGRYSLYSSGVTNQNYLRGVQITGSDGTVSFTTVFPGCYAGRVPHIHFEVYANAAAATSYQNQLRTSQLALPLATCATVYAAGGYGDSAANLANESFATDMVFSDGVSQLLATLTGSVSAGYAANLTVAI